MCQSRRDNRTIIKYADDSVIVSLLQDSETGHGPVISDFVGWCDASHLQLNIAKTQDMFIDLRKKIKKSRHKKSHLSNVKLVNVCNLTKI